MDDSTSMVDIAQYFMEFCRDESCGKCIPCRVGTVQLYRLLSKIRAGEATQADMQRMKELCRMVQETSLCGLGQSAATICATLPVLGDLRWSARAMWLRAIVPVAATSVCMQGGLHQRDY